MISRKGSLLEKNVEKIFKLAGFNTKRGFVINGYELDVYAEYGKHRVVVQCKQYERSNLNVRDLIHQWESKSKKINIDRVLISIYGNEINQEDIELANEYGIILWGEKELDEIENYVMNNPNNSASYLLEKLKINDYEIEEKNPKKKTLWPILLIIICFILIPIIPLISILIGLILIIYIIIKSKKKV